MIFRGRKLFNLKVGLVLAGGGAKGAYQAGVIRALWDVDLINNIEVVSGVSIGTLNALCLCMKDKELIERSWRSLSYSKIVTKSDSMKLSNLGDMIKRLTNHSLDSAKDSLGDLSELGLISQKGIRDYIKEFVNVGTLNQTDIDVYCCAYNVTDGYPEYFKLNDYNEEDVIDITLGSCAVPYIFPSITFKGKQYADGGINNPRYSRANADNVPITPLKNHQLDLAIVVHLTYTDKVDRRLYPQKNLIEIYPSNSLELINGSGTLNFNQASITEKIQMGYRDTLVTLTPMLIAHLKGKDIYPYIKQHSKWNEQFLKRYQK